MVRRCSRKSWEKKTRRMSDKVATGGASRLAVQRSDRGRRRDAEEPKLRSDDGLFLELVVPNSIVAGNDDPAVEAGFP